MRLRIASRPRASSPAAMHVTLTLAVALAGIAVNVVTLGTAAIAWVRWCRGFARSHHRTNRRLNEIQARQGEMLTLLSGLSPEARETPPDTNWLAGPYPPSGG